MNGFVFCRFSPFNFPQENMESRKNPIERKHSSFRPAVYSIYVMMQLPLSSFIYMFYSSSSFFIFLSLFVLLLTFYIYISINSIDFSCTDVQNVDCNPDVYKILLMSPCLWSSNRRGRPFSFGCGRGVGGCVGSHGRNCSPHYFLSKIKWLVSYRKMRNDSRPLL